MTSREGWRRVEFGDVVRNVSEAVADPVAAGLERAIGLEHLDSGDLAITRWASADGLTFTRRFRAGQVLYGRRRVYQRKAAVPDFDGVCSGDIYVLEPSGNTLLPELLPFIVQSESFHEYALRTSAGSLSPRTKWADLTKYDFDLPPIEIQRSLADELNACEELRRKRSRLLESCRLAERALLEHVFDPAWPTIRTDEAGHVQLGLQRHPKYQTGKHAKPYLRVANVGDDELFLEDVLSMDFAGEDFDRYRLEAGDVLLNEGQSIELVGRVALYAGEIRECCFQKTLLRFRPSPEVDPLFALSWFRRAFYRGDLSKLARRTSSMAHLTAVRFRAFPFPLPSPAEQRRVVETVGVLRDARLQLTAQLGSDRAVCGRFAEHLLRA